jgi:apolipoprotein N-acyltransferase
VSARWLPRRREGWAALVSGTLLTLSFPPFHLLVPPFVALVPWLVHLADLPPTAEGRGAAIRSGFWLGVVYFGLTLYWLFTALVWYTPIAFFGYLLTVLILSGIWSAAAYALHDARASGWPLWLAAPVAWTAAEWLHGHLLDLAFPWLGLGTSLTGFPWLAGAADLVGARGLSFWLACVNGLIAEGWLARRARGAVPRPLAIGLAAALVVPAAYSLARWFTLQTRPAARVAVLQPNIPEHLKLQREAAKDSTRRALENLHATMPPDDLDLLVWPEVTYPGFVTLDDAWQAWIAEVARERRAAVLVGGLDYVTRGPREFDYFNAAFLHDTAGTLRDTYHKRYLVPVVERVPFVPLEWIREVRRSWRDDGGAVARVIGEFLAYFGGFARGETVPVLSASDARFGVLICYESAFASLPRRYRNDGAEILVNITNDAWFGRDEPWWSRTAGLVQHPAHLVMRAIENRVGVARSANTGISMIVDPRGRVVQATDLFVPAVLTGTVETTDGRTGYARWGDVVGWLSFAAGAGWLAWIWIRRRRARAA